MRHQHVRGEAASRVHALQLRPHATAGCAIAHQFVDAGDNSYGARIVTNPSGGLLSKGHPRGATGLVQCTELVQQPSGTAGQSQVECARLALQHELGLGGACVMTMDERV